MKKVALLTIYPTQASVENYRPASSYAPQYLAMGLRKGMYPHSRIVFRCPIRGMNVNHKGLMIDA